LTKAIQMNWPPLRLPRDRLAELQAGSAVADRNPLLGLTAQVKVLASGGHFSHAHKLMQLLEAEHSVADGGLQTIRCLWPAAIMAHAPDVAVSLLKQRYNPPYRIELEIGPGLPVDVTLMRVHGDNLHFQLSPDLFEFHAGDMILDRWVCMFPLWDAFMRSSDRIDGSVAINLLDNGSWPGLAFCEYRLGYHLIPDSTFMGLEQYKQYRIDYAGHEVAWQDRAALAYWRGSTSGIPMDPVIGWRSLPRIRLCEIAAANAEMIDAGITGISQIGDPDAPADLESRNLMRPRVSPATYLNYRYQIDIDGNSSAWDGFFLRLLTGSPVLKVASPFGYRQWYYDRLQPWVNFVPVETDMSDLVEKVAWLRDHDDAARKIGEAGRALADALDERELSRAIPVITAAMQTDGGGPSIGPRFGTGAPPNVVLGAGWHTPGHDGVATAASECQLTLSRPPGPGDYVLLAEVSIMNGPPRLMTIVANGKPLLSRFIADRTTACCPLSRAVAAVEDKFDLTFCFPDSPISGPDSGMMLHRIGIAAAGQADWLGYPNIDALLAELNAGPPPLSIHDLGWTNPERTPLVIPPGAVPRTLQTYFGTILYADRETGRIRHGQATEVPRNLFAIPVGDLVLLARAGDNGGYIGVHVRPEGPHAPRDPWKLWAGCGFARSFTMIHDSGGTSSGFCLRAAGLIACAEHNGEFTLSRLQPGEWEGFHFMPDTE
jgi:hypothetical protein